MAFEEVSKSKTTKLSNLTVVVLIEGHTWVAAGLANTVLEYLFEQLCGCSVVVRIINIKTPNNFYKCNYCSPFWRKRKVQDKRKTSNICRAWKIVCQILAFFPALQPILPNCRNKDTANQQFEKNCTDCQNVISIFAEQRLENSQVLPKTFTQRT